MSVVIIREVMRDDFRWASSDKTTVTVNNKTVDGTLSDMLTDYLGSHKVLNHSETMVAGDKDLSRFVRTTSYTLVPR